MHNMGLTDLVTTPAKTEPSFLTLAITKWKNEKKVIIGSYILHSY